MMSSCASSITSSNFQTLGAGPSQDLGGQVLIFRGGVVFADRFLKTFIHRGGTYYDGGPRGHSPPLIRPSSIILVDVTMATNSPIEAKLSKNLKSGLKKIFLQV